MESVFSGAIEIYNETISKINTGEIQIFRGNVCPICLDTGFLYTSEFDQWGKQYFGVIKSIDCCRYWQRRAEQITEHRKIDKH